MQPRHPLYIVSKGRWDTRLTMKALEKMGVPYFVVVESQEAAQYRAVLNPNLATVLVLDPAYQHAYDVFAETPGISGTGSGPARNFAGDHARSIGASWHWVIDDNIWNFYRLNRNAKIQVRDGTFFRAMEDFCDRYENVAMAGPNYQAFCPKRDVRDPFTLNTRIYSCNLIRNDVPLRWRGRYNEDTDLSLRMLKAGWCTVLFNAFLHNKVVTQRLKGGNTDTIYAIGTLEKSRMLVAMHPDVAKLTWKFGRWHHHVDYRPFKANRLKRKPGLVIPEGTNEYGMRLVRLSDRTTAHAEAAD